jgi:xylan 1,4-beta-xylosidase
MENVCCIIAFMKLYVLALAALTVSAAAVPETITIDASAPTHPLPHFWEQMFGSGRANLSLRDDYRKDLRSVRDITGFQYIRFHAILDDENGVYDEDAQGKPIYNFSYVDQIYDGMLANNIKPFVEISFMPKKLALNPQTHPFWYKPYPSPPNDSSKWSALITAFAQHLKERYGKAEVDSWYFEVWNEPNIDFWDGNPQQSTYFQLYDETAKALKAVDAGLRVGGPATAQAAWVDAFIAHCTQNHIPFDFVSTHVYGNDTSKDVFGTEETIPRRDMVARAEKKVFDQVKASASPNTPIIWSEYNATYMNQQEVTDSAFMGPWLANHIRESDGLVNMISYWCFSDVFEEQGVVKTPFYGGYGLIAERDIPKAAYRAFELLHKLGDTRIEVNSDNALVTKTKDDHIVLALWNYAEPGQTVPPKEFKLELKGFKGKKLRYQMVAPGSGSPLEAWKTMGSPSLPTQAQIEALKKASELAAPVNSPLSQALILAPQPLVVAEVF